MRLLLFLLLLFVAGSALAQAVVPDPAVDPLGFVGFLPQLVAQGAWGALTAGVVILGVLGLSRFGPTLLKLEWFGTQTGKLVTVVLLAVGLSVMRGLLHGLEVIQIVSEALVALVGAIGIHSAAKNAAQAARPTPASDVEAIGFRLETDEPAP